ncbi:gatB [Acrasis kona]|uniref:GatB n=1 Tax=Acrasis kona TaxID=1008807 RepID=A0AAW2ZDS8_9EUKA
MFLSHKFSLLGRNTMGLRSSILSKNSFVARKKSTDLYIAYNYAFLSPPTLERIKKELKPLGCNIRIANPTFFKAAKKNSIFNRTGPALMVTTFNDHQLTGEEIIASVKKINTIVEGLGDINNIYCYGAVHNGLFYPTVFPEAITKPKYSIKDMMVTNMHKNMLMTTLSLLVRSKEWQTVTITSQLTNNISNTYNTL